MMTIMIRMEVATIMVLTIMEGTETEYRPDTLRLRLLGLSFCFRRHIIEDADGLIREFKTIIEMVMVMDPI